MAHTIVILGASGDLTSRKLIPALYGLFRKKRLPEATRIVGFARTPFSHDKWREKLTEIDTQVRRLGIRSGELGSNSLSRSSISRATSAAREDFAALKKWLDELEAGADGDAGLLSGHRPAVLRAGHRAARRGGTGRRIARRASSRHRKAVRHRSRHRQATQ